MYQILSLLNRGNPRVRHRNQLFRSLTLEHFALRPSAVRTTLAMLCGLHQGPALDLGCAYSVSRYHSSRILDG